MKCAPQPGRVHPLDEVIVFDPDGHELRLGSLRAGRTTAFVFLRHFGCLFCRQQLADLAPFRDRILSAGAQLAAIGHGTVAEARAFCDEHRWDIPVLTDPNRQAYCAIELQRGLGTVLRASVVRRALQAWRQGFRQGRNAGDPLQQGGAVVIAADGRERYRHVSQWAGDHPSPRALVSACEAEM